ncbi:restriction endonuclease subunit S [Corallococcus sp. AB045]|uniref:restriction endonuclease subunit S n=1 Tax=Corallococcus sp. AB045 TaxID=2316719 RepID=UPI000EC048D6|nr:restriction endonuclease subunit S [Corallococcus sp. AB045]RKH91906.1 restriction endonuclease subunit S [Corallococcus sp. AB045]
MIDGLKPYQAYRDSSLIDRTRIPHHWTTLRAKGVFYEVDEKSSSGKETLLSVSHISGVRRRSDINATMFLAKSNVGHKRCQPDDLVVNTMWAWMGALGVSPYSGIVSPAYAVYRQRDTFSLLPKYTDHLLRTPNYIAEYTSRSTGIHSSRLRMYPEAFFRAPLIIPPHDEQAAIVRFLAHANRRVDDYVRAKKKIIRAASDARASVTDEVIRKYTAQTARLALITTLVSRPVTRARGASYIRLGLRNRGRGIFHKPPQLGEHLGDSEFFWVEPGDLIISGQFAWEGAVAIATEADGGTVVSHRYPVLRARPKAALTPYLWALLRSGYGELLLDVNSRGAAGRNRPLNHRALGKEKIPVPPLEEQQRIAEFVAAEADARRSVEREIAAVQEYRARLIADIVTGQLDVRDVAAALPPVDGDEPSELLAADSDDDQLNDEDTEAA